MVDFWNDPRMLAEGNARGIPGGDPDFPPTANISDGTIVGTSHTEPVPYIPDPATLTGDLNAHAERLGIPVETLVTARQAARPARRGFALFDRLATVKERLTP
jgi:hypothetical protein